MAKYGAKYPRFAPFAETDAETDSAYPKYGTPVTLAELVSVADAPTYNEAKQYGDDQLVEYASEFKEASLDFEITEIDNATAKIIYGAQESTGGDSNGKDLMFGAGDNAPFGGIAFYVSKLRNNVKKYQGVYYPKCKASMQGETYTTKGESIAFVNAKAKFMAYAPKYDKWKVLSPDFTSESEAKAWVDEKIKSATS